MSSKEQLYCSFSPTHWKWLLNKCASHDLIIRNFWNPSPSFTSSAQLHSTHQSQAPVIAIQNGWDGKRISCETARVREFECPRRAGGIRINHAFLRFCSFALKIVPHHTWTYTVWFSSILRRIRTNLFMFAARKQQQKPVLDYQFVGRFGGCGGVSELCRRAGLEVFRPVVKRERLQSRITHIISFHRRSAFSRAPSFSVYHTRLKQSRHLYAYCVRGTLSNHWWSAILHCANKSCEHIKI